MLRKIIISDRDKTRSDRDIALFNLYKTQSDIDITKSGKLAREMTEITQKMTEISCKGK